MVYLTDKKTHKAIIKEQEKNIIKQKKIIEKDIILFYLNRLESKIDAIGNIIYDKLVIENKNIKEMGNDEEEKRREIEKEIKEKFEVTNEKFVQKNPTDFEAKIDGE